MTTRADVEQRINEILRDFSGRKNISPADRIHEDLSIAGDDAAELLGKLHDEFGTTFEGFAFDAYFPNETEAMFYGRFLNRLGWFRKKSIMVRHLTAVVRAGKWFEEAQPVT